MTSIEIEWQMNVSVNQFAFQVLRSEQAPLKPGKLSKAGLMCNSGKKYRGPNFA